MLADQTLRDLLAAFASPTPAPAGGSASALASAVGASLLIMAATLPRTRAGTDEDRQRLAETALTLTDRLHQLTDAVDRDADVYRQVVAAPGGARQAAIMAAIDVPLQVMRWSAEALSTAPIVAARCHRPASSDVRVGIELLRAGLAGARSSAQANLRGVRDARYVDAARAEIARWSREADAAVMAALAAA